MDEYRYWQEVVKAYHNNPNWRYGQAAFNVLADVRPDLAEKIRGEDCDPFYLDRSTGEVWVRFREYIKRNW